MEIDTARLWEANRSRRWPRKLLQMHNRGDKCKDTATIAWWIEQFKAGAPEGEIYANRRTLEVADGNHRLVAAFIAGRRKLQIIFT